jgi:hypothetical protein
VVVHEVRWKGGGTDLEGINSAWETIQENIKISAKDNLIYYELKKHKPWFDEGCSKLLHQRKQAKKTDCNNYHGISLL